MRISLSTKTIMRHQHKWPINKQNQPWVKVRIPQFLSMHNILFIPIALQSIALRILWPTDRGTSTNPSSVTKNISSIHVCRSEPPFHVLHNIFTANFYLFQFNCFAAIHSPKDILAHKCNKEIPTQKPYRQQPEDENHWFLYQFLLVHTFFQCLAVHPSQTCLPLSLHTH